MLIILASMNKLGMCDILKIDRFTGLNNQSMSLSLSYSEPQAAMFVLNAILMLFLLTYLYIFY